MEFDHVFIRVEPEGNTAEVLKDFGLDEASSNTHPGQGTSNRRFFFRNSFIELLYVSDKTELNSELTQPTRLNQRLNTYNSIASPFGVCFRPSKDQKNKCVPFPAWDYRPNYLPNHLKVDIGEAPLKEPMWFYLEFSTRPDKASKEKLQSFSHSVKFNEITGLRLGIQHLGTPSECAMKAYETGEVRLFESTDHVLEIEFDNVSQGNTKDFRPIIPLVFRW